MAAGPMWQPFGPTADDPRSYAPDTPADRVAPSLYRRKRGEYDPITGEGGESVSLSFPPDYYPPPGSVDFGYFRQLVGLTTATGRTLLGAPQVLPVNLPAVIRDVTFSVSGPLAATTDVLFRILASGAPVQGWDNVGFIGRVAVFVGVSFQPESVFIRLPGATSLNVDAIVGAADAGTYTVGAYVRGWSYPS